MPSVTTTTTTEVKISPALKRKLLVKLKTFAVLKAEIEARELSQDRLKADMEKMFVDADEFDAFQAGVAIEGFSLKHVAGVSKSLNKVKLMEATGITAQQLNDAYVTKPKKAYVNVRCPGEAKKEEE